MKWKVCGLKYPDNIDEVLSLQPDYIGMIFYMRSARFAGATLEAAFARGLEGPKKVGVFVNEDEAFIQDHIDRYGLHVVQLHGQESPALLTQLKQTGVEVIKTFSVKDQLDIESLKPYESVADFFLFDTKVKGKLGGTGQIFNWEILQAYPLSTPYFLSGGLSLDNIPQLMSLSLPGLFALDINSKFEQKPGRKDLDKLRAFTQIVKQS